MLLLLRYEITIPSTRTHIIFAAEGAAAALPLLTLRRYYAFFRYACLLLPVTPSSLMPCAMPTAIDMLYAAALRHIQHNSTTGAANTTNTPPRLP